MTPSCRAAAALALLCAAAAAAGASSEADEALACVRRELPASSGAAVHAPGSAAYAAAVRIDNVRVAVRPAAVVSPDGTAAVAAAMRAARACGLAFSALGGGHSAAGYSLAAGGLTLNTRALNHVYLLDDDRAAVGGGARWKEVYAAVQRGNKALLPVGGGCPEVGVGGFLQGGGWSFLSRGYGLGSDSVVGITAVLANGTVVRLSDKSAGGERDLFWAMRGGGGGNFGVVTEYTLQLHRPAPVMSVGAYCWPEDTPVAREIFAGWAANFSAMPDWMNMLPVWLPAGPGGSRKFCVSVFCDNSAELCDEQTAWVRALAPTIPGVHRLPYLEWQLHDNANVTDAQGGFLDLKSYVVRRDAFNASLVDKMIAAVRDAPSKRNLVLVHLGGGAISRIADDATAFVHRDAMIILQTKAIWDDPSEEEVNRKWLRDTAASVAPHVSGAYVNYIDRSLVNWGRAYYGDNYDRLVEIKRSADPDNFFKFPQSIGSPQDTAAPVGPGHGGSGDGGNGGLLGLAAFAAVVGVMLLILGVTVWKRARKSREDGALQAGSQYEALNGGGGEHRH